MPTTIAATNVSIEVAGDAVQRGFQRATFLAMGRHWLFYIREGVIPVLVFESSVVGSGVWSGETPLFPLTDGAEFSLTLQEVTPLQAFVHLAWADATGANPLQYARGNLAAAGTIAWDPPQTVVAAEIGWEFENIGICLSMGIAPLLHIVYTRVNIADPTLCTPWITLSVTVNGTWTQGAGYPLELTATDDPGWIPLVTPYGAEVLVVYSAQNINIFSRLLTGGILQPEVDTGTAMGVDAGRMSIVSRRITSGGSFYADAVFLAYQGADWDLYCIEYDLGWQMPVTIQSIGNFREANPLLSIMYYGDDDAVVADHELATLYCFWTPTTDIPTAEWVTYRLSRDQNITWTNEAGADAAEEWIDETSDGFEVQQSGSVFARNYENNYNNNDPRSYIGIAYVTHTMPATLRFAALAFNDPDEDLAAEFYVGQVFDEDLAAAFVVRHSSPEDIGAPDLYAKFSVQFGEANLLGEFVSQQAASEDLLAGFFAQIPTVELLAYFQTPVFTSEELLAAFNAINIDNVELLGIFNAQRSANVELLGIFVVRHPGSEDLYGEFDISRADWMSQGLNVSVYRDLGVIS